MQGFTRRLSAVKQPNVAVELKLALKTCFKIHTKDGPSVASDWRCWQISVAKSGLADKPDGMLLFFNPRHIIERLKFTAIIVLTNGVVPGTGRESQELNSSPTLF